MTNDSTDRIVAGLRKWIASASPGAQVPSNRALMAEYGASPVTVQKAMRRLSASGLVEIGSHSYRLHNLGGDGGNFESGRANGVERRPNESDADFQTRVLDDIQLSHDRIAGELGGVTCFAYPFGCSDPDAKALVDDLFPVTLMTTPKCADLSKGLHDLPRYTVTMKTDLGKLLR